MNRSLPPTPFQVLIVAKTRLKRGFCIGGIAQNGCSVRLGVPAKDAVANFNCEYSVGDVWLIEEYRLPRNLTPPHTEDMDVLRKKKLRVADRLLDAIERLMPPVVGGIDRLFGGAVQCAENGRLYIAAQNVPNYSTLFWRPDRPLQISTSPSGSFRYVYKSDDGDCFLSYVGTAIAKPILPAGILIRLSLARLWRPEIAPEQEPACYLQVSGWFDESGVVDEQDEKSTPINENGGAELATPVRNPIQADLPTLLKRHFGFAEFRPYQREIIESVLLRRDTLVIMSTGAGKSLCFQLPAIAFPGLTVVISPLIALMQDQVAHVQHYGIAAATLNSQLDVSERHRIIRQIRTGKLKLLYMSPERLVFPATIDLLKEANVECLVVDEAHCISQWGHEFRPDYREILKARKALGNVPIMALTATATPDVQEDITVDLGLSQAGKFVAPFDRPNLFLAVQPRQNGLRQVLDFLKQHRNQAGIIYCATKKQVNELTADLNQNGVSALAYHADLDDSLRVENQRRFIYDEVPVMVATVAFGMGIDKPDVRFVVHYNLPCDPESYYQQIGRAGRDGDRADCLLLHAREDFRTNEYFISKGDPERAPYAAARLQHMAAWVKEFTCRRKWLLEYFGEIGAPENCGMCDACVADIDVSIEGKDDITTYASLFLNCVKQVRQGFGIERILQILCGSKRKKLIDCNHDQLPIFGQGNALRQKDWDELVPQLFELGLVTKDNYGAVKLTPRGQTVLDGKQVFGYLKTKRQTHKETVETGDDELFEKLRKLRRELADVRGVPAFVIFSDRSLRDMVARMPKTAAEFRRVHGVGDFKWLEFGETFLKVIQEHCKLAEVPVAPVPQVSTIKGKSSSAALARREKAIAALQSGKPIAEVADECGLQQVTIIRYVYRYHREFGIFPEKISFPPAQVSNEIRAQVFQLFDERGLDELGPIYWAMHERVQYIDLDLLRIEYMQQMQKEMVRHTTR